MPGNYMFVWSRARDLGLTITGPGQMGGGWYTISGPGGTLEWNLFDVFMNRAAIDRELLRIADRPQPSTPSPQGEEER